MSRQNRAESIYQMVLNLEDAGNRKAALENSRRVEAEFGEAPAAAQAAARIRALGGKCPMPIDFECASCRKPYSVRDDLAGRKVRCNQCDGEMRVPGVSAAFAGAPAPVSTPAPASTPTFPVLETSPLTQAAPVQVIVNQRAERPAASGLGVAGVVLGVIALLVCWMPPVNLMVLPLAGIGGLLALIGLLVALTNKRAGPGWAVAGLGLNAAAFGGMLIINTIVIGAAAKTTQAVGQAMETARAEQKAKEQALRNDRDAIARKAVDGMLDAAESSFGTENSMRARITADPSGIKEFGEDAWEVTGAYVGPDQDGKRFKAPFTARIRLMFGTLQCMKVKLGDREELH